MNRKNTKIKWFTAGVLMLLSGSAFAVDGEYLSDFDLVWNRTPKAYEESAFLGNGELGTCIWSARDETLHFDIGDTRVYSEKSRAPIGKFILNPKGKTSGFSMRLGVLGVIRLRSRCRARGLSITSLGEARCGVG